MGYVWDRREVARARLRWDEAAATSLARGSGARLSARRRPVAAAAAACRRHATYHPRQALPRDLDMQADGLHHEPPRIYPQSVIP